MNFDKERKSLENEVSNAIKKYIDFSDKVSPTNFNIVGNNINMLRNIREDIKSLEEISENEKEIETSLKNVYES